MADIFKPIIERMRDIGMFNFFLPFLLTSAIFYGLLRKSKIFGMAGQGPTAGREEPIVVNAVIAIVAAFMVWAFPIMSGIDVEAHLSAFFMQGMVVTLVFMTTLMIISMVFKPDLPTQLESLVKTRSGAIFLVGLGLGIVIFLTSSLWTIFIRPSFFISVPSDILITLGTIILLILPLFFIVKGG